MPMRKKYTLPKQYRTFNGKRYSLHASETNKAAALRLAKWLRDKGANARVVKSSGYYRIYVRE